MSNLALFDLEEPPFSDGRDDLDRYYTPEWASQALVDYLGARLSGGVWDPCCGKDWGGRVFRRSPHVVRYLGTDIDPDATSLLDGDWVDVFDLEPYPDPVDFVNTQIGWGLGYGQTEHHRCHWIVTNPPYLYGPLTATDFVRHALTGTASVAMLLRLTWLEPCSDRVDILTEDPPTDVLILPRVNFIGAPGSNPCTSAWVIWDRSRTGSAITWHRGRA